MKKWLICVQDDKDRDALIEYLGYPDYSYYCWGFNSLEELRQAEEDIPDSLDYTVITPYSRTTSSKKKLFLSDFYLFSSYDLDTHKFISADLENRLDNSLAFYKGNGSKVYLLLNKKDKLPDYSVSMRLAPVDGTKRKSILKGFPFSAHIIWRGKNISKNVIFKEGTKMKQVTIKEETIIPGTKIILEKNDRILYQANKLKESKLDDVKRKLKSFGFEDQGDDTWDNYEGTEVILGDNSLTISSEEDPYGGDEISFSEFLRHPGEYLS